MSNEAEHLESLLAEYVDGQLDAASAKIVEQHLASNPATRAAVEQMKLDREALRSLPRVNAPADLSEDLRGRLERDLLLNADPIGPMRSRRVPPRIVAIAASLVAGLALVGVAYVLIANRPKPYVDVALHDSTGMMNGPTTESNAEPAGGVTADRDAATDRAEPRPMAKATQERATAMMAPAPAAKSDRAASNVDASNANESKSEATSEVKPQTNVASREIGGDLAGSSAMPGAGATSPTATPSPANPQTGVAADVAPSLTPPVPTEAPPSDAAVAGGAASTALGSAPDAPGAPAQDGLPLAAVTEKTKPTAQTLSLSDQILPADAATAIETRTLDPNRRSIVLVVDAGWARDALTFASRVAKDDENGLEVTDAGQRLASFSRARLTREQETPPPAELAVVARDLPEASASSIQSELRRLDENEGVAFDITPTPAGSLGQASRGQASQYQGVALDPQWRMNPTTVPTTTAAPTSQAAVEDSGIRLSATMPSKLTDAAAVERRVDLYVVVRHPSTQPSTTPTTQP